MSRIQIDFSKYQTESKPFKKMSIAKVDQLGLPTTLKYDYWIDKHGNCYYPKDMSDFHIKRVIQMLDKFAEPLKDYDARRGSQIDAMLFNSIYDMDEFFEFCMADMPTHRDIESQDALDYIEENYQIYKLLMDEVVKRNLDIY